MGTIIEQLLSNELALVVILFAFILFIVCLALRGRRGKAEKPSSPSNESDDDDDFGHLGESPFRSRDRSRIYGDGEESRFDHDYRAKD